MVSPLAPLLKALKHQFRTPSLLQEALTHPSTGAGHLNYERLEFLGDRVLGLVVAHLLFQKFPKEKEGALARRHSNLVRQEMLVKIAKKLNLSVYINVSKSERVNEGHKKSSILANTCEALIGALYLDGGFAVSERFIRQYWEEELRSLDVAQKDAKSQLQEWTQAHKRISPVYTIVEVKGTDHDPLFIIEAVIEGFLPAQGEGKSKREAMQKAAQLLLTSIEAFQNSHLNEGE